MRLTLLSTFIFLLAGMNVFSQADSVMLSPDARLNDGIYLSYSDFRGNRSIKKEQIISKQDKGQLEFLSKTIFEEKFSYVENGQTYTIESKTAWGYAQNNTLYVNFKGDFYRVPVFGSISYLVATVTVINPGFYDPRFGMSTGSGTTKEIREFIMNFYDGFVLEFTVDLAEQLLSRDKILFEDYKKLGRRKQKEQIYGYIRKYNAQHPVYFVR